MGKKKEMRGNGKMKTIEMEKTEGEKRQRRERENCLEEVE